MNGSKTPEMFGTALQVSWQAIVPQEIHRVLGKKSAPIGEEFGDFGMGKRLGSGGEFHVSGLRFLAGFGQWYGEEKAKMWWNTWQTFNDEPTFG